MSYLVAVSHTWTGSTQFEFEDEQEAETFQAAVRAGDIHAIIEQGDIDTSAVELTDFDAGRVRKVGI